MRKYHLLGIAALLLTCLFSCKKEIEFTNEKATLHFSSDTILFDTIFTTVGSITHKLRVYNKNDFNVRTNIQIVGENATVYSINVNGNPGNEANNVEIPKKDSIWIFIEYNTTLTKYHNFHSWIIVICIIQFC